MARRDDPSYRDPFASSSHQPTPGSAQPQYLNPSGEYTSRASGTTGQQLQPTQPAQGLNQQPRRPFSLRLGRPAVSQDYPTNQSAYLLSYGSPGQAVRFDVGQGTVTLPSARPRIPRHPYGGLSPNTRVGYSPGDAQLRLNMGTETGLRYGRNQPQGRYLRGLDVDRLCTICSEELSIPYYVCGCRDHSSDVCLPCLRGSILSRVDYRVQELNRCYTCHQEYTGIDFVVGPRPRISFAAYLVQQHPDFLYYVPFMWPLLAIAVIVGVMFGMKFEYRWIASGIVMVLMTALFVLNIIDTHWTPYREDILEALQTIVDIRFNPAARLKSDVDKEEANDRQ